jgi:hypothetical protein
LAAQLASVLVVLSSALVEAKRLEPRQLVLFLRFATLNFRWLLRRLHRFRHPLRLRLGREVSRTIIVIVFTIDVIVIIAVTVARLTRRVVGSYSLPLRSADRAWTNVVALLTAVARVVGKLDDIFTIGIF